MKRFFALTIFCFCLMGLPAFAQVTVSASVDKPNPKNLDDIKYTVTVTNPDPLFPAVGVEAVCPIPRGIKFKSANPSQGNYNTSSGLWTIGAVSPSSSVTLDLSCFVNYFNSAYDVRDYYNYNILLRNDATFTGSSIGGKTAAGHDISLTGVSVGGLLPTLNPAPAVLNAGNNLTFNSGSVFHGNVVYGASTNLPSASVVYPQGVLQNATPFDFTGFSTNITEISTGLATHLVTGTATLNGSKLTLTSSDIYLNVFTITTAEFSSADTIDVNIPKGSIGIINVLGLSAQYIGNVNINGNLNNFILFNFPTATDLSIIGSRFQGTILAPLANVNCIGTFVQGQIFSNNLNSISAHDLSNFVGYVPLNRLIVFSVAVTGGNFAAVPLNVNTTPPFGAGGNGNWSVSSVLPDNVWVLSLVRKDSNNVLAGTFGGRIYHVDNNGIADTLINASMTPVSAIWSLAVNDSGHIFAATSSGLLRSNDNGLTWSTALPNLDVRSVLLGLDSNVYAGTWGFGLFKSTDHGYTWSAKNQNIGSTVINALMDKLDTNALSTPYTIFAAAFQKGLSATWNNADSWLPLAMPHEFVTAMGKSAEGVLFLGTQVDGVYRSYDNGNSFHKLSGIPNGPIYSIKVDGDNNIFVSSWMNGIYASSDLGDTWSSLGLGGYGVSSLFALPNGKLIAGTRDGKLYRHDAPLTSVSGKASLLPTAYKLEQNYPNPFNPATVIRYEMPEQGSVSITVYDMLGKEVKVLVNEFKEAGSHTASFNGAGLASGVYYYRIQAGSYSAVKKMLLLK